MVCVRGSGLTCLSIMNAMDCLLVCRVQVEGTGSGTVMGYIQF